MATPITKKIKDAKVEGTENATMGENENYVT